MTLTNFIDGNVLSAQQLNGIQATTLTATSSNLIRQLQTVV